MTINNNLDRLLKIFWNVGSKCKTIAAAERYNSKFYMFGAKCLYSMIHRAITANNNNISDIFILDLLFQKIIITRSICQQNFKGYMLFSKGGLDIFQYSFLL